MVCCGVLWCVVLRCVTLCNVMLRYVGSCCVASRCVLRCVVLCCVVLCCVVLCCVVLCCVVLCCVVLCCVVLCCVVLCCVVLCCVVLCCVVLCCVVLCTFFVPQRVVANAFCMVLCCSTSRRHGVSSDQGLESVDYHHFLEAICSAPAESPPTSSRGNIVHRDAIEVTGQRLLALIYDIAGDNSGSLQLQHSLCYHDPQRTGHVNHGAFMQSMTRYSLVTAGITDKAMNDFFDYWAVDDTERSAFAPLVAPWAPL